MFAATLFGFGSLGAQAQNLKVTPQIDVQGLWSSNISLQPGSAADADFVTTITPGLTLDYRGPRGFLRGSITAPIITYARSDDKNQIVPVVDLAGQLEVVRNLFFIDTQASVAQTYFSPFGARPAGVENITDNRYTAQSYRITPYIKDQPTSLLSYEIRNDNRWSIANSAPVDTDVAYTNEINATINRAPTPVGWGADFIRSEYWTGGDSVQRTLLARLRGVWQPDPQFRVFVTAGYEDNEFPQATTRSTTYGGGFSWRPTTRTSLDASYEHRFFGASYGVTFSHRMPKVAWSLGASRNLTNYPNALATIPPGVIVPLVLDVLLQNRIPDFTQRLAFIRDYMIERGLPLFLDQPLTLYDQRAYVVQQVNASVGLLGVRNTVFFSAYRSQTEALPQAASAFPPEIGALTNNTQTGAGVSWSYQLAPQTSLTASANYSHTTGDPPFAAKTDHTSFSVNLTRALTPRSSLRAGARWQRADSSEDVNDYKEAAVFAGFHYTFR